MMSTVSLRGRKVSERSLEFNVLSEVLERVRRFIGKAYIVGYTTRQEAFHGLDASIDAPGVILAGYQFKAPSSGRNNIYKFRIGDRCWICSNPRIGSSKNPRKEIIESLRKLGLPDTCVNQHTILYATAVVFETRMNIPIYYALPLIRDYVELEQRIPGITNYTVLIRVRDLPIRTVLDCNKHIIEVNLSAGNINNISINIYSSKYEKLPRDKYIILGKMLEKLLDIKDLPEAKQTIHLDPEDLQQILEKELRKRAKQEGLEPNLSEKAGILAKAITMISFSYRGRAIVLKSERRH